MADALAGRGWGYAFPDGDDDGDDGGDDDDDDGDDDDGDGDDVAESLFLTQSTASGAMSTIQRVALSAQQRVALSAPHGRSRPASHGPNCLVLF